MKITYLVERKNSLANKILKMKLLFATLCILFTTASWSQDTVKSEDQLNVEKSVLAWADSMFKEYNEPRFEKFVANVTDEYLMVTLREEMIDKSMARLEMSKKSGRVTDEEFEKQTNDLEKRKSEAHDAAQDFKPKVSNYTISFWANFKLDSGVFNYIEYKVVVSDDLEVVKYEKISGIGAKNDGAKVLLQK